MVVDDAHVSDPGTGNLKLLYTDVGSNGLATVAGAFVPLKNIELSGSVANGSGLTVTSLGSANASGINGIATCNGSGGG